MIKSILAVAVVGAFSATAFAAMPSVDNGSGVADVTKINNNFTTLDNSKLDKSTYANNALLVNSKLAEKVDTATFNTAVDKNKTNIKANTDDIHKLQNKLVENEFHDHAQDQNIGVNKNNIEKNKANIEANKNAIAANYAEMKNNFAAVNSRIDKLDDKMKKGFAAQAALNGLFQPYSVGKFNVTAAIGGYDSEQAMALGTGYRFNENFALKAGIASDLSGFDHVTYNIGANFEF